MQHRIFIVIILVILSTCIATALPDEKQKNHLPGYSYELPIIEEEQGFKAHGYQARSFATQKRRVLIILKDPQDIPQWNEQLSSMNHSQKKELKQDMREFLIKRSGIDNFDYAFNSLNGFSASLTQDEIDALKKTGLVAQVVEDKPVHAFMADTVNLINASPVWNITVNGTNLTGKGQTVCVIDTGIAYNHESLGACSLIDETVNTIESFSFNSTNYPNNYSNDESWTYTITKPGYSQISVYFSDFSIESDYDFLYILDAEENFVARYTGTKDPFWSIGVSGDTLKIVFTSDELITGRGFQINATGDITNASWQQCSKVIDGWDFHNYDYDPMDDGGHGTHVAGTIAGNGTVRGVAPDAKLVAIKALGPSGGYDFDVAKGIEYCTENAERLNISVISMSLGSINYTSYCDSSETLQASAINAAVAKNISVVIASGNDGAYSKISAPACIHNATPVTATDKSDNYSFLVWVSSPIC